MNGLNNCNKTYREYSSVPTDDLIRFWTSKGQSQGHDDRITIRRVDESTHVSWRGPRSVEVDLLVLSSEFEMILTAELRILSHVHTSNNVKAILLKQQATL